MTLPGNTQPEDESAPEVSGVADGTHGGEPGEKAGATGSSAIVPSKAEPPDAGASDGAGRPKTGVIAIPAALDAELKVDERAVDDAPGAKPRTVASRLLDYSAHAAMIVGLLGFAWTVSNHVVTPSAPSRDAAALAPVKPVEKTGPVQSAAKPDPVASELAELRRSNDRLAADIGGLRAQLGALAATGNRMPGQVKALQAALDSVQSSIAAVRSEGAASAAQINARIDGMARERGAALVRPERGSTDLTTGSLPSAKAAPARPAVAEVVPVPPAKPEIARSEPARPEAAKADMAKADLAKADMAKADPAAAKADADKPPVIAAYVVRDVAGGVALIEGRRGILEVVPGVSVPGAGVVKSIERRGKGWAVITTKGQIAFAAPPATARRESRRDYYPGYRYDF